MTRQKVPDDVRRRRDVALAGYNADEALARHGLVDDVADVRAAALGALARMGRLAPSDVASSLADVSPVVRRRACEVAIRWPAEEKVVAGVVAALADADGWVTEAACFALGETGPRATPSAVAGLADIATTHRDPLCREAAVAALGAIGDPKGLPAIVGATHDKPAIRRRAVLALAPFAGPDVDAALQRALVDRDWQVRQAAEDLLSNP